MIQIVKTRNIWLGLSALLVTASIVMMSVWGFKLGIDFTGGSLLEVSFAKSRPAQGEIQAALVDLNLGGLLIQPAGDLDYVLRFQETSEEKHQEVLKRLRESAGRQEEGQSLTEKRFDSVGPSIGQELKQKSWQAMILVLLGILSYIAYSFRQVSRPVASWKYGISAIVAVFHDVIITLGFFSFLGHFYGIEINTPFVAALLTVLGYSVNDTIVVFDRIRENLPKSNLDFEGTVNASLNQTILRSIYTSLTTMLSLLAILFFGGETIRDFVSALIVGIFFGTYSSIFVASPILVSWERWSARRA